MKSFSVTVPSEIVPAADDASAASKDEPAAGASSASKGSGSGPGAKTPDDGWPGPWFTVLAACVYALAALYQWRYPTSGLVEDEMTTLAIRRVNGVVRDAACGGWEMSDGTWSSFAGSGTAWHLGAIARERCGAKKLSHLAAAEVIDGRRVVVIGDSSARHVYAAIVRAAHANASAWSEARDMDAVANGEKHRDWEFPTPGVRGGGIAAFKWAPYAQNITSYLAEIERGEEPAPDVLVMGAALWHALHVRSEEEYLAALRGLKTQLAKTTAAVAATPASFASDGDGDGGDDRERRRRRRGGDAGTDARGPARVLARVDDDGPDALLRRGEARAHDAEARQGVQRGRDRVGSRAAASNRRRRRSLRGGGGRGAAAAAAARGAVPADRFGTDHDDVRVEVHEGRRALQAGGVRRRRERGSERAAGEPGVGGRAVRAGERRRYTTLFFVCEHAQPGRFSSDELNET